MERHFFSPTHSSPHYSHGFPCSFFSCRFLRVYLRVKGYVSTVVRSLRFRLKVRWVSWVKNRSGLGVSDKEWHVSIPRAIIVLCRANSKGEFRGKGEIWSKFTALKRATDSDAYNYTSQLDFDTGAIYSGAWISVKLKLDSIRSFN